MSHHYPEPFYHFKSEHHLTNLSSAFKSLYDTADLVDITISVDGGTVKAHRVMLAASSPYFRNIIKSVSSSQYPVVFLKDVSYKDLGYLVEFIYKGEVTVDTPSIESFMKAAQMLQIVGLCQDDLDEEVEVKTNFRTDDDEEPEGKRRLFPQRIIPKRTTIMKESTFFNETVKSKKQCLPDHILSSPDFPVGPVEIEDDEDANLSSFEAVIPVSPDTARRKPPKKQCPYCDQMLSIHAIVRHIKDTHNINEKIKCSHCPKLFKNKNSLGCHNWRFHKVGSPGANGHLGTAIVDQMHAGKDD